MQIEIPPAERQKLEQLAAEAGFNTVEAFVGEHVRFLATNRSAREILALTPTQMAESLESCDRGLAEIDAGNGQEANQAMLELGRRRGFSME